MNPLWLLRTWPTRRALHAAIRAGYEHAPRPAARDRARIEGQEMLRVRLIGSGLAVGYGVEERAAALDGHLARRLAAELGRGVVVENSAEPDEGLSEQILAASVSGSWDLTDVVVWCPSSLEMCRSRWIRSWSSRLSELLQHVSSSRQVVVLALPLSAGDTELIRVGTAIAARINRGLEHAAARFANVTVVHPPVLQVPRLGEPSLTGDYYRRCGDAVCEAVLRVRRPGAVQPSSTR